MDQFSYVGGLSQTDWLCFSFLSGIGPARLSRLYTYLNQLEQLGSGELVGDSLPDVDGLLLESGRASDITYELLRALKWPDVTARQAIDYLSSGSLNDEQQEKRDQTLDWLSEPHHHLLLQQNEHYPQALKEIDTAPAFLYGQGSLTSLGLPKIGIVGARKCTGYGRDITLQLAEQLASRGICVVSGGAIGIDTAAHQGALHDGSTPTLAVMGTGLQHRYPNKNSILFDNILYQGGLLVSEYPLMTSARPHLFPPRNRIISGLSIGVLVVEASTKSGSLISANYAIEQNREVFAVPGRLFDTQSEGCHQLLRQGATLVRNIDDILSECSERSLQAGNQYDKKASVKFMKAKPVSRADEASPSLSSSFSNNRFSDLPLTVSSAAKELAQLLERESQPLDFDALIRHTKMHTEILMQGLMELELSGCVENRHGAYSRC
ncbi:DNA-protecting protein DprA [Marinomonas sp. C1424]|uniref:DNA-protecting protein DprA n=2 Tax=Marinomonas transparens TaxID=2795388 RepID=A0A934JHX7_9GAMM|nr:DNA-protecting protein DprA [Marinomonas transparens]